VRKEIFSESRLQELHEIYNLAELEERSRADTPKAAQNFNQERYEARKEIFLESRLQDLL
jgi:hypothetical protein